MHPLRTYPLPVVEVGQCAKPCSEEWLSKNILHAAGFWSGVGNLSCCGCDVGLLFTASASELQAVLQPRCLNSQLSTQHESPEGSLFCWASHFGTGYEILRGCVRLAVEAAPDVLEDAWCCMVFKLVPQGAAQITMPVVQRS